jgi:hypothetical protein
MLLCPALHVGNRSDTAPQCLALDWIESFAANASPDVLGYRSEGAETLRDLIDDETTRLHRRTIPAFGAV